MRFLALFLLPTLLVAGTQRPRLCHRGGPVRTAREAKAISEQATGGRAVSARRVPLNGASGGWEVDIHMPKEDRGWRCIVDNDTHPGFEKRLAEPSPAIKLLIKLNLEFFVNFIKLKPAPVNAFLP